jgi:transposase
MKSVWNWDKPLKLRPMLGCEPAVRLFLMAHRRRRHRHIAEDLSVSVRTIQR